MPAVTELASGCSSDGSSDVFSDDDGVASVTSSDMAASKATDCRAGDQCQKAVAAAAGSAADKVRYLEAGVPAPPPELKCNWRLFAAGAGCAVLNNLFYAVISGAAQDVARQFHREDDVAMITTALFAAGFLSALLCPTCLTRFRYSTRIILVILLNLIAFVGTAKALWLKRWSGFWVCVVCSFVAGAAVSIGAFTNLAFFRVLPSEMTGAWAGGDGAAGIIGALLYVTLRAHFTPEFVFLCGAPLPLLYGAMWLYIHKEAIRGREGQDLQRALGGVAATQPSTEKTPGHAPRHTKRDRSLFARVVAVVRVCGPAMLHLAVCFGILTSAINLGLADRATLCSQGRWFTAMMLCTSIGSTLGRGSVVLFRTKHVWVFTLLQFINVVGWAAEVLAGGIREWHGGYVILTGWMVVVGLIGGLGFGNCLYFLSHSPSIPDEYRELGISLAVLALETAHSTTNLFFLLFDRTFFSSDLLYPAGCSGLVDLM